MDTIYNELPPTANACDWSTINVSVRRLSRVSGVDTKRGGREMRVPILVRGREIRDLHDSWGQARAVVCDGGH